MTLCARFELRESSHFSCCFWETSGYLRRLLLPLSGTTLKCWIHKLLTCELDGFVGGIVVTCESFVVIGDQV